MSPAPRLRQIAERLYVDEQSFRFFGIEAGRRMTVVVLPDGGLWLHAPNPLEAPLRAELDALGPVRFVVAPNRLHHLALDGYASAYPDAALVAAPRLPPKRPDLTFRLELDDTPPAAWAGVLDQRVILGAPRFHEVAFLHRPSRSLLITDHLFLFGPDAAPLTRLLARALRAYNRPLWIGEFRPKVLKDRAALRASVDALLAWDFDRIVTAHGSLVESGGPALLRAAYQAL